PDERPPWTVGLLHPQRWVCLTINPRAFIDIKGYPRQNNLPVAGKVLGASENSVRFSCLLRPARPALAACAPHLPGARRVGNGRRRNLYRERAGKSFSAAIDFAAAAKPSANVRSQAAAESGVA